MADSILAMFFFSLCKTAHLPIPSVSAGNNRSPHPAPRGWSGENWRTDSTSTAPSQWAASPPVGRMLGRNLSAIRCRPTSARPVFFSHCVLVPRMLPPFLSNKLVLGRPIDKWICSMVLLYYPIDPPDTICAKFIGYCAFFTGQYDRK